MKVVFNKTVVLFLLSFISLSCQTNNTVVTEGEDLYHRPIIQDNVPVPRKGRKPFDLKYSAKDQFEGYPDEYTTEHLYTKSRLDNLPKHYLHRLDISYTNRDDLFEEPSSMLEKMIKGQNVSLRGDSTEEEFKKFYFKIRELMKATNQDNSISSYSRIMMFSSNENHFKSFELFPKVIPMKGESYNLINCSFNSKSKEEDDDILEFSDDQDVIEEPIKSVEYADYSDDDEPVQKETEKVVRLTGIRLKAIDSDDIQKIKDLLNYQEIIKFWIEFQDSFSSFHQLFDILNKQKLKKLVLNGTEETGEGLNTFLLKLPTASFWNELKTLQCLNLPNEIVFNYLKSLKNLDNFYWRPVDSCNESLPVAPIPSVKQLHLCLSQVKETETIKTIENILKIFPNVEKIKIELNGDFPLSQIPTRTLKEITVKCNKMENESDFMQSLFESGLEAGNISFFNGSVRWRKQKDTVFYQFVFEN